MATDPPDWRWVQMPKVTVDGENQHVYKTARIGLVQPDGQIKETWNSGKPIKPDPYLKGYPWATGLS